MMIYAKSWQYKVTLFRHIKTQNRVYRKDATCLLYFVQNKYRRAQRLEFQRITAQQSQLDLRLSWGSDYGSYCSNILNRWAWPEPELFSLSPLKCISIVIANKWEGAFFWPIGIQPSVLWSCDTQTRMRLRRGASPKVSLRWQDRP